MRNTFAVALLATSVWGYSPDEVQAGRSNEADSDVDTGSAEWVSYATGGTEVTVRPSRSPIEVGPTDFHITLDRAVPDGTPVSIDIVSPEMLAMGILRYPAEEMTLLSYMARADIAMDGAWEVYVNLGDGTDAAAFEFDVAATGAGAGHSHGETTEDTHGTLVGEDPRPNVARDLAFTSIVGG